MHCIVYIFYLKRQRALQSVRCQNNRAKLVDEQWLFNPSVCIQRTRAETLRHQPGFRGFSTETGKKYIKKKIITAKREKPLTLAASKNELCVCKTTKQKRGKKKSRKKEKLSISSENQRRLPHWLFPFVILIVLMTPKIPKISFSVRSAFCLCSSMILTVLSDIWYVQPQLRYPKERIIYATAAANLERDIFCVSRSFAVPATSWDAANSDCIP